MTKFIAHDDNLIWAVGDTAEAAMDAARKEIGAEGEIDENWPEPQASINATLERLRVCRATDALTRNVEAIGGAIVWRYLKDGTACTFEEEDA